MMIISLICIGFSSWNITNQIGGQSLTGSIKADNVINSSEYIDFNPNIDVSERMTCFSYCDIGFISEEAPYNLTTVGYIKAKYRVKLGNCKSFLNENEFNSLKVDCTLSGTNSTGVLSVFSEVTGVRKITGLVEYDKEMFDVDVEVNATNSTETTSTFSFIFKNLTSVDGTGDKSITIVFKFEILSGTNYFKRHFYDKLGNDPVFTVIPRISGINVME